MRTVVLADGIEVKAADLANDLLSIGLERHEPERLVRRIDIGERKTDLESLSGYSQRSRILRH